VNFIASQGAAYASSKPSEADTETLVAFPGGLPLDRAFVLEHGERVLTAEGRLEAKGRKRLVITC
jgi:hypothetical protein